MNQGVAFMPDHLEVPSQNLFAVFSEEKDLNKLAHLLQQLHQALDKADPEGDEMRALTSLRR
jgi:hypothetical protein